MGHRADYTGRIEAEKGQLVYIVNATWKDKSEDIYKEYEDGTCLGRYYSYSTIGGYLVSYPGEKYMNYYGSGVVEKMDFEEVYHSNFSFSGRSKPLNKEALIEALPRLYYLISKYNSPNIYGLITCARLYKEYPKIEMLVQLGQLSLATNKTFLKMKPVNQNKVLRFVKQNIDKCEKNCDFKMNEIRYCIKNGIDYCDYQGFKNLDECLTNHKSMLKQEIIKYVKRKVIDPYYYTDYFQMCKKLSINVDDDYWAMPNDIKKKHDEVASKINSITGFSLIVQAGLLKQIGEAYKKFDVVINGYRCFIPSDYEDVVKVSEVLKQCLIRNDYVRKMVNQENLLLFIWKDGVPKATAELFFEADEHKRVGQFYGDESCKDRIAAIPNQELKDVLDIWLSRYKPTKLKFNIDLSKATRKHYYKGFDRYDPNTNEYVGFGNYRFRVGESYATIYSDETIVRVGSKCVATPMVFHFCDNIKEISRHYLPKVYCEVEPLGPIVENDGALLSNRIKILRSLTTEEVNENIKITTMIEERSLMANA